MRGVERLVGGTESEGLVNVHMQRKIAPAGVRSNKLEHGLHYTSCHRQLFISTFLTNRVHKNYNNKMLKNFTNNSFENSPMKLHFLGKNSRWLLSTLYVHFPPHWWGESLSRKSSISGT